ncbi:hypothetical protein MASR1M107_12430 [Ignavibacteriales bacterium]
MIKLEEMKNWFAPVVASGENLPENGRLSDGTFYLLRIGGIKILYLYSGGERLQVATLPAVVSVLPKTELLPEHTKIMFQTVSETSEYIIINGKWVKIT